MERESFVFYRSFAEAIDSLPAESYKTVMCAINKYALDGKSPELTGIERTVFLLVKPQIDANNRRYENSLKGGRKPSGNQDVTKPQPTQNQVEGEGLPNANANANGNENGKGNENDNAGLPPDEKVNFETFCSKTTQEWKRLGLTPEFRYTLSAGLTAVERSSLWPAWERWSLREAIEAERNLARVRNSPDHLDPADKFKYPGFMAGGVGAYLDTANPWEKFRKPGSAPDDDPLNQLARDAAAKAAERRGQ